jgi:hypothetical protein
VQGHFNLKEASLNEEKKPTETEIIREKLDRITALCAGLSRCFPLTHVHDFAIEIAEAAGVARVAHEARDKSRKLSLDVSLYDFTEPMVRALLSQGFELALNAVVGQLKTVQKNGRGMISWSPPVNPFLGESTKPTETAADKYPERATACTCPNDPPGRARVAPDCPLHNVRGTARDCDCNESDKAQGIHLNECTPERPWKRRSH